MDLAQTTLDGSSADIAHPSFEDLFDLAALRTWSSAHGQQRTLPEPFPVAGSTVSSLFTHDERPEDRTMSSPLSVFSERWLPITCVTAIRDLLSHPSVLQTWPTVLPDLSTGAELAKARVIKTMQRTSSRLKKTKKDFIVMPVNVQTDQRCPELADVLWKRAVAELSAQLASGNTTHIPPFLGIHAFLRDPVGGLSRSFTKQTGLFRALLMAVNIFQGRSPFAKTEFRRVVAQAAQESAFLAAPYLDHVVHIHFHGHQQLSYVYVPLRRLARSEFSRPEHVLDIIREILTSTPEGGLCPIVPIAIATYPNVAARDGAPDELTVIIDGNHRVTAVMLLRMFARHPAALRHASDAHAACHTDCADAHLGAKWRVDLQDVVRELFSVRGAPCRELLTRARPLVQRRQFGSGTSGGCTRTAASPADVVE